MKTDWITNGVFAALATATFYFVQLGLESTGVARTWAVPIAVLTSALGVGVLLRIAVTALPFKVRLIRRMFLPASVLEGIWLEVLNRRGKQHYSIVRFQYDPAGQSDPFSMIGHSFFPDGDTHSEWDTRFIRIKGKANGFSVEYIYVVETPDQKDRPKHGYGESWFTACPGRQNYPAGGKGYYLAAEESSPFRCPYQIQRIDDDFKRIIGAERETLETSASMEAFVQLADAYYKDRAETRADDDSKQSQKSVRGVSKS